MAGFTIRRTVFDSIPVRSIKKNGIIETEKGVYTRGYVFEDINFKLESTDRKLEIFDKFGRLLNSIPTDMHFQFVIINQSESDRSAYDGVQFPMQNDGYNRFRIEKNMINAQRIEHATRNLVQKRYLILSCFDVDIKQAIDRLLNMDSILSAAFKDISVGSRFRPMTTEERLYTLFEINNQDGHAVFYNAKDKDGKLYLDATRFPRKYDARRLIAPSGFQFDYSSFRVGESYGCVLYLATPAQLNDMDFVSNICDMDMPLVFSMTYEPQDQEKIKKKVRNTLGDIQGEKRSKEKSASRDRVSSNTRGTDNLRMQVEDLQDDINSGKQKMFKMALTICVFGASMKELNKNKERIISIGKSNNCTISPLIGYQEYGYEEILPLSVNRLNTGYAYITDTVASYMPFTSHEINQKTGYVYGTNKSTNNIICYDRRTSDSYSCIIFGKSGKGKSVFVKSEITDVLLNPSDKSQIIILDPNGEYAKIARAFGGEVVKVSPSSNVFINPMDLAIDITGQAEEDPVNEKANYIITIFAMICGPRASLTPEEEAIVDLCVHQSYEGYIAHLEKTGKQEDKAYAPTFETLQQKLMEYYRKNGTGRRLIEILRRYTSGSMSIFSHRTTINTNARIIDYDLSKIGAGMKALGSYVCLNNAWNATLANNAKGVWTRVYADEFHYILRAYGAAAIAQQMVSMGRKYNLMFTMITQASIDFMSSDDSKKILELTEFVVMFDSSENERRNFKAWYHLSDSQLKSIQNASPGQGLFYCDGSAIPFESVIPRVIGSHHMELYDLFSTSKEKDKMFSGNNG